MRRASSDLSAAAGSPLPGTSEVLRVRAVVVDFDGTLAGDQRPLDDPQLIAVFKRLRAAGVKVIINTGRDLEYLIGPNGLTRPEHVELFDAFIVECGGAVWFPGTNAPRPLTALHSPELVAEMRRVKIPSEEIWWGHTMVATMRTHRAKMQRAIANVNRRRGRAGREPLILDETLNIGSATYLPPGITKGSALVRIVVNEMGIPPSQIVGAGDGNNDVPFLSLCALAIVPRNGLERLKALPNAVVASADHSAGVAEVLTGLLRNGLRIEPPQRGCALG